ncbi:hypothetical protein DPMN_046434 [Dreissena polymorpha]|uniref:Uncharacterized protein n=1 Tax=Dreissena polymorpha TaxID=45954 RepID=A0A9D4I0V5_DREPO|nr:hypothetical protein DPMN_046434 [Dreissena polymorpha]
MSVEIPSTNETFGVDNITNNHTVTSTESAQNLPVDTTANAALMSDYTAINTSSAENNTANVGNIVPETTLSPVPQQPHMSVESLFTNEPVGVDNITNNHTVASTESTQNLPVDTTDNAALMSDYTAINTSSAENNTANLGNISMHVDTANGDVKPTTESVTTVNPTSTSRLNADTKTVVTTTTNGPVVDGTTVLNEDTTTVNSSSANSTGYATSNHVSILDATNITDKTTSAQETTIGAIYLNFTTDSPVVGTTMLVMSAENVSTKSYDGPSLNDTMADLTTQASSSKIDSINIDLTTTTHGVTQDSLSENTTVNMPETTTQSQAIPSATEHAFTMSYTHDTEIQSISNPISTASDFPSLLVESNATQNNSHDVSTPVSDIVGSTIQQQDSKTQSTTSTNSEAYSEGAATKTPELTTKAYNLTAKEITLNKYETTTFALPTAYNDSSHASAKEENISVSNNESIKSESILSPSFLAATESRNGTVTEIVEVVNKVETSSQIIRERNTTDFEPDFITPKVTLPFFNTTSESYIENNTATGIFEVTNHLAASVQSIQEINANDFEPDIMTGNVTMPPVNKTSELNIESESTSGPTVAAYETSHIQGTMRMQSDLVNQTDTLHLGTMSTSAPLKDEYARTNLNTSGAENATIRIHMADFARAIDANATTETPLYSAQTTHTPIKASLNVDSADRLYTFDQTQYDPANDTLYQNSNSNAEFTTQTLYEITTARPGLQDVPNENASQDITYFPNQQPKISSNVFTGTNEPSIYEVNNFGNDIAMSSPNPIFLRPDSAEPNFSNNKIPDIPEKVQSDSIRNNETSGSLADISLHDLIETKSARLNSTDAALGGHTTNDVSEKVNSTQVISSLSSSVTNMTALEGSNEVAHMTDFQNNAWVYNETSNKDLPLQEEKAYFNASVESLNTITTSAPDMAELFNPTATNNETVTVSDVNVAPETTVPLVDKSDLPVEVNETSSVNLIKGVNESIGSQTTANLDHGGLSSGLNASVAISDVNLAPETTVPALDKPDIPLEVNQTSIESSVLSSSSVHLVEGVNKSSVSQTTANIDHGGLNSRLDASVTETAEVQTAIRPNSSHESRFNNGSEIMGQDEPMKTAQSIKRRINKARVSTSHLDVETTPARNAETLSLMNMLINRANEISQQSSAITTTTLSNNVILSENNLSTEATPFVEETFVQQTSTFQHSANNVKQERTVDFNSQVTTEDPILSRINSHIIPVPSDRKDAVDTLADFLNTAVANDINSNMSIIEKSTTLTVLEETMAPTAATRNNTETSTQAPTPETKSEEQMVSRRYPPKPVVKKPKAKLTERYDGLNQTKSIVNSGNQTIVDTQNSIVGVSEAKETNITNNVEGLKTDVTTATTTVTMQSTMTANITTISSKTTHAEPTRKTTDSTTDSLKIVAATMANDNEHAIIENIIVQESNNAPVEVMLPTTQRIAVHAIDTDEGVGRNEIVVADLDGNSTHGNTKDGKDMNVYFDTGKNESEFDMNNNKYSKFNKQSTTYRTCIKNYQLVYYVHFYLVISRFMFSILLKNNIIA